MAKALKSAHGAPGQVPDREKLRQLVLYVASRSQDDPRFGRVKLNKLIYYADFANFRRTGRSITGSAYIRMPFGPCAEDFHKLEEEMSQRDELKIQRHQYYGHIQERPIALVVPDLSRFSGEEIAVVEEVISEHWERNATETSLDSHLFVGWDLASEKEQIPYGVARLHSERELTAFHYDLARDTAKRLAVRDQADAP